MKRYFFQKLRKVQYKIIYVYETAGRTGPKIEADNP